MVTSQVSPFIVGALVFSIGIEAMEVDKFSKPHLPHINYAVLTTSDLTYAISASTTGTDTINFMKI